jgi:hypothetical protein
MTVESEIAPEDKTKGGKQPLDNSQSVPVFDEMPAQTLDESILNILDVAVESEDYPKIESSESTSMMGESEVVLEDERKVDEPPLDNSQSVSLFDQMPSQALDGSILNNSPQKESPESTASLTGESEYGTEEAAKWVFQRQTIKSSQSKMKGISLPKQLQ